MLFTLSHPCATFLAATGGLSGIWLLAGFAPMQLGYCALTVRSGFDLATMVSIKVFVQSAVASPILMQSAARVWALRSNATVSMVW